MSPSMAERASSSALLISTTIRATMKRAFGRILLTAVMVAVGALLSSCAAGLRPDTVTQSLAERGPQATLESYFSCEKYEGSAYEKIATGAQPWVALAEKMIAHSDACYTEGIQAALGEAMRKAPQQVLGLVDKTSPLSARYICLPFISAEQPIAAQLEAIDQSRRAIASANDPQLAVQQAACLRFIDELGQRLRAQAPTP